MKGNEAAVVKQILLFSLMFVVLGLLYR